MAAAMGIPVRAASHRSWPGSANVDTWRTCTDHIRYPSGVPFQSARLHFLLTTHRSRLPSASEKALLTQAVAMVQVCERVCVHGVPCVHVRIADTSVSTHSMMARLAISGSPPGPWRSSGM